VRAAGDAARAPPSRASRALASVLWMRASLPAFHTPVRGYAFAAVPPPRTAVLEPGTPVALIREPDNPADPLAVGVWLLEAGEPRWRLGYLDRTVASRIAPRLDAGTELEATLDGWVEEPDGRWRRPLLHLRAVAGAEGAPTPALRSLRRQPPGVRRRRVRRRT
jgi:hypothetical protein